MHRRIYTHAEIEIHIERDGESARARERRREREREPERASESQRERASEQERERERERERKVPHYHQHLPATTVRTALGALSPRGGPVPDPVLTTTTFHIREQPSRGNKCPTITVSTSQLPPPSPPKSTFLI